MIAANSAEEMQARRHMRFPVRFARVLMFGAAFSVVSHPQSAPAARPRFEVATVKTSGDGAGGVRATTGRLTLEHVPLRVLVSAAYKTRPSQIAGGPSWVDSAMFSVDGKASEAAGTDVMLLMLQVLLEDRFHLRVHHESREGPIYNLTIAKGVSRLKPAADCVAFDPNHLARQTAAGETQVNYCGRMLRQGYLSREIADATGVDMVPAIGLLTPSLTGFLSEVLDRTVVNQTGLAGAFDFHLEWSPQRTEPLQADDVSAPSIFTAIQEQLGLKLDAGKGPVDFLVIDRAEKPAAN
jgi:uncharacterized protein (TIGR03435 family)